MSELLPLIQTGGLLLAAVGSMWLTGAAVAGVLLCGRTGRDPTGRSEFHGLALLLGIGGVSWLSFVWSACGGALGRTGSIAIGVLGSLSGSAVLFLRRRAEATVDERSRWSRFIDGVLALLWLNLLLQTVLTPQRLWDERAIFGIKSAVLFEDESLRSESLRQPQFVQGHPRYPLLLPLAEEFIYGWLGRVDDRWSKLIAPLAALGLWLAFAGVLERHVGRDRSRLAVLLLAAVPGLTTWEYGYLCVQADAIVASFHGLSVLYLWDAWRTRETSAAAQPCGDRWTPWGLAGLAAGFGLFTKDEGIALAMVDGVALACVAALMWLRSWPRTNDFATPRPARLLPRLFAWFCPLAAIALPWVWWRSGLPSTNEMAYFGRLNWESLWAGRERLEWAVPHFLHRMFGREALTYGLMWWGVVAGVALAPRRSLRPSQFLLILDMLGAICGILIAGMLAPLNVQDHIGGSSHRFLLQLIPTAVLFLAGQTAPSPQDSPPTSPGDSR